MSGGASLAEVLAREPVFAVTADVDWASEPCIGLLLDACAAFSIRPTVFVTHHSPALRRAGSSGTAELAIHPNFLPGSSHGSDPAAVVAHIQALVPGARGSRAHCFASSSHIIAALVEAGLGYDSGPLLLWQQGLVPLRHGSGLVHLPVFWEDDAHWGVEPDWDFGRVRERFLRPGLKIINVHPFVYALNIPTAAFYRDHKSLIPTLDAGEADRHRHAGAGCASFTRDVFSLIASSGARCCSLGEIFDWHREAAPSE